MVSQHQGSMNYKRSTAVADVYQSGVYYARIDRQRDIEIARRSEMAGKDKQAKEPKKKPQKTMLEKRKEKREKEANKHEE